MFHNIPQEILDRMRHLEERDARDRTDGTPHSHRMRQIPPETGKFLALLVANTPDGALVEIGTSAGYSTLWLALACREVGRTVATYEISEVKAGWARETFDLSGVSDVVTLVHGDAREALRSWGSTPRQHNQGIAFCFLDAEKADYLEFYDLVVPNLVRGGLLAADNASSHGQDIDSTIQRSLLDERVDALVVPIGKGVLVCRKR